MTHFGGRDPDGPTLQDAEDLVRSLVGVAAVRIIASPDGSLQQIIVVPESESGGRQVSRNVTSALMARFGVDLDPETISIRASAADTLRSDPPAATREPPARAAQPAPAAREQNAASAAGRTDSTPRNGKRANGNGNGVAHDAGSLSSGSPAVAQGPAPSLARSTEPAMTGRPATRTSAQIRPRLELAELVRTDGLIRCRVVVAAGSERFTGVGDGDDARTTDLELAGRVTIDALRAARTPRDPIQFDGAVLADIAGRAHVAVSLSIWNGADFETIAGAAPVLGSPAEAAAHAVIDAIVARLIA